MCIFLYMGVFYRPPGDSSTIRCILPFCFIIFILLAWSPIIKKILSLNLPVMPPTPPCHMALLLSYSTYHPYATRLLTHAWSIRYINRLYAYHLCVSLGLTSYSLCAMVTPCGEDDVTIWDSQASGGGQLTSNLMCVMITTEAITNPYHSLPYPVLTMRNRLVD